MNAIVMTEEFWANSQLSVVRYTGHIYVDGHKYVIVNRDGIDVFELSVKMAKNTLATGQKKIIAPGEPCDLCRADFVPIYRKLGRERFFEFLEQNPDVFTVKQAKERLKNGAKI